MYFVNLKLTGTLLQIYHYNILACSCTTSSMIDNLSKPVGFSVPLLRSAQEVVFSKAGAKLLLFFDMTKFSATFLQLSS